MQTATLPPEGANWTDTEEVFVVTGQLGLDLTLPEGMSAKELTESPAFQKSVKEALVAGLGEGVDAASVLILSIEIASRRLDEVAVRRLGESAKITVNYMITVKDEDKLTSVLNTLSGASSTSFADTFTRVLQERSKANGMGEIVVKSLVVEPPKTEAKIVERITTKAPKDDSQGSGQATTASPSTERTTLPSSGSGGGGGFGNGGNATAPDGNQSSSDTGAGKAKKPPLEIEGGDAGAITGGVVGCLIGLGCIGAVVVWYKKRKKAKVSGREVAAEYINVRPSPTGERPEIEGEAEADARPKKCPQSFLDKFMKGKKASKSAVQDPANAAPQDEEKGNCCLRCLARRKKPDGFDVSNVAAAVVPVAIAAAEAVRD